MGNIAQHLNDAQPQYQQPPAYGQQSYPQQGYPQQGYGQQAYNDPTQGFAAPYQPAQALSPDHLEQMVAPIALYPDNLVSMVLAASTYPAQVAAADQWLHMQGGAPPEQIAAGANAQSSWDPSVKALTAFPQVLDQLAQNLAWTTDLGNAYYNQPQDVMQTIQVMRSRAQQAGNLQTTPQQEVIQDQGNIEIAPPTPQVVYVPQYNPWAAYGQPVDPYPGFNVLGAIGSFVGDALLQWGPGIAMQAFAVTPFGWLGWGLDWLAHAIFFGGDVWCTHSGSVHDWGFAHGGGRYWGSHGELAGYRNHGGFGGPGGWQHNTFRSGLDSGNFPHAIHSAPGTFNGGNHASGNQGNIGNRNGGYGGGNGSGFGRSNPGGGSTYNHGNGYQSSGNTNGGFPQRNGGNGYGPSGPSRAAAQVSRLVVLTGWSRHRIRGRLRSLWQPFRPHQRLRIWLRFHQSRAAANWQRTAIRWQFAIRPRAPAHWPAATLRRSSTIRPGPLRRLRRAVQQAYNGALPASTTTRCKTTWHASRLRRQLRPALPLAQL